jgi:hypothetical protein
VRKAVRPLLADVCETERFLASKKLVLDNAAKTLLLNNLYDDLSAVLKRLRQISKGDYSPTSTPSGLHPVSLTPA